MDVLEQYARILQQARGEGANAWNRDTLERACQWSRLVEKILNVPGHQSSALLARVDASFPVLSSVDFRHAEHTLLTSILLNPLVNDDIHHAALSMALCDGPATLRNSTLEDVASAEQYYTTLHVAASSLGINTTHIHIAPAAKLLRQLLLKQEESSRLNTMDVVVQLADGPMILLKCLQKTAAIEAAAVAETNWELDPVNMSILAWMEKTQFMPKALKSVPVDAIIDVAASFYGVFRQLTRHLLDALETHPDACTITDSSEFPTWRAVATQSSAMRMCCIKMLADHVQRSGHFHAAYACFSLLSELSK